MNQSLIISIVAIACISMVIYWLLYTKKRAASCQIHTPNGIDEGEYVTIGGIQQFLYHRGENKDHPVLLFLHGGPGSPMLPFAQDFQFPWEDKVTVVHWEQRNSGKTFFANDPQKVTPTTTIEQALQDTYEVVSYLQKKYNKERILLLGHSWGSILGSLFTLQFPQMVQAYIGVGQVVNMFENERIGYEKALECSRQVGNQKDISTLQALSPYPEHQFSDAMIKKLMKLRKLQGKYKLAMQPSLQLVTSVLCSPFYSFKDIKYMLMSDVLEIKQRAILESLFKSYDLNMVTSDYQVPVFYIHGVDDWQTPYSIARTYFDQIKAPMKQFYSIPNAGHVAMLDQKELFNEALFDIIDQIKH